MKIDTEIRLCPECSTEMQTITALQTITVGFEKKIEIEKCPNCEGLFFDNQELQNLVSTLKEYPVETVLKIDSAKDNVKSITSTDYKCPICEEKMQKANFESTSGVTFDYCLGHGVYLNKGELTAIIRWKKSQKRINNRKAVESCNNRISKFREKKAKSRHSSEFDSDSRIIDFFEFIFDWFIWDD